MKLHRINQRPSTANTMLASELMLAEQALFHQRIERNEKTIVKNNVDDRILSQLRELMPVLKKRVSPAFDIEQVRDGFARVRCAGDDVSKLLSVLSKDHAQLAAGYPCYIFFPVYRELLKLLRLAQSGRYAFDWYLKSTFSIEEAIEIAKHANRFVEVFIKVMKRPLVKKEQENFERSPNDNFQSLLSNIAAISERYLDAVVLRFDMFYQPADGVPVKDGDQPQLGHLHELLAHRTRFHAWLRKRFKSDLLLYAWALEHGRERGLHHHYLMTLKPRGNEDHVNIVHEIDDKWSTITLGLGSIYNGNEARHKQRYKALGLVSLNDPNVITGLQLIASYITLAGVYVKLNVGANVDAFGKGGNMGGDDPQVYLKAGRPPKRQPPVPIAISAAEGRARYVNFI
ncbi:hypothetical protein [Variovorax guangxiensis]|nr:hypothetical protein [Variovorax guangxiensis]